MQSAKWLESISSRAALRERRISALDVSTDIPAATLVEQAGVRVRAPCTFTTHR